MLLLIRWTKAKYPVGRQIKNLSFFFKNNELCLFCVEEESIQHVNCVSSKPMIMMVWGCICAYGFGNLHIWKGTINVEWSNIWCHPGYAFSGKTEYFRKTRPDGILLILQMYDFTVVGLHWTRAGQHFILKSKSNPQQLMFPNIYKLLLKEEWEHAHFPIRCLCTMHN